MNLDNIRVNAQSSIRIETNKVLYFDPFKIEDEKHDADFILITHDHFDHYDISSIKKIINNETIIIAPLMMKDVLAKEFSETDNTCLFLKPNDEIKILDVEIAAIGSYNIAKPFHPQTKEYTGYVVKVDGVKYYVAGDTDENEDNLKVKCDVALVPIGGKYTMNTKEAASFVNKIKPNYVIPTHFGKEVGTDENQETFKELVDKEIKVIFKL